MTWLYNPLLDQASKTASKEFLPVPALTHAVHLQARQALLLVSVTGQLLEHRSWE